MLRLSQVRRPPQLLARHAVSGTRHLSAYAAEMHKNWKANPSSVHPSWAAHFAQSGAPTSTPSTSPKTGSLDMPSDVATRLSYLVSAYRVRGHEMANLNPLFPPNAMPDALNPDTYGFLEKDLDRTFNFSYFNVNDSCTLRDFIGRIRNYYCGPIGFQYMHINDTAKCDWLRSHIEADPVPLSKEKRRQILERTAFAEQFELFLANKWNTAKRFGIEGCDSMTPGLKAAVDMATTQGVTSIDIGMAHRGRLNVLTNVIRKPLELIFKEFAGKANAVLGPNDWSGSGDVKYHLGTTLDRTYDDGRQIHLSLLHNPSHLECVNPLVAGKAKARMHFNNDETGAKTMPIVIHGDSAMAGQGIVYECLQMANLKGYGTGGSLQVVCNNQIGFTTDWSSARSTTYASDIAAAFQIPVFHCNADDPEAVVRAFELAVLYRCKFHTDVCVDLIGYRRNGHNELDQPLFTNPALYKLVSKHPTVLKIHTERLLAEGAFTQAEIDEVINGVDNVLTQAYDKHEEYIIPSDTWAPKGQNWRKMKSPKQKSEAKVTGVSRDLLAKVGKGLTDLPEGFTVHRQLKKVLEAKQAAIEAEDGIDWATAEALAFGTLLQEGVHCRITGQDVERGTFNHRHARMHCQTTMERVHVPLNHIEGNKQVFSIFNSPLSEFSVLGFELGYSMHDPNTLTIWEAQFGDFSNGAQVIIDQFLAAQETKWGRQSGLVMLLPHGYEEMGPEHSSARLERYLAASDEDPDVLPDMEMQIQRCNWQVVNCTTPANYFHVLRRQVLRDFRKPLIVMSPKRLLKLARNKSSFADMAEGTRFQRLIPEKTPEALVAPDQVRRVVMCSGKIYYELLSEREKEGIKDVAIVRVEQICPFPFDLVAAQMEKYPSAELVWCQEEPKNMGAWDYVSDRIMTATRVLNGKEKRPGYVGRATMSSPAEGYGQIAAEEQAKIVSLALSENVTAYRYGKSSKSD